MFLPLLLRTKPNLKVQMLSVGVSIFVLISVVAASAQPGSSALLKSIVEHADSTHTPIVLFDGVILHNNLFLPFDLIFFALVYGILVSK